LKRAGVESRGHGKEEARTLPSANKGGGLQSGGEKEGSDPTLKKGKRRRRATLEERTKMRRLKKT